MSIPLKKSRNTQTTRSNIDFFESENLNKLGSEIIELNRQFEQHMKQARKNVFSAFRTRWEYGKLIYENIDEIKDECGSQKSFAERIGETPAVVSNNKRGYKNLLDYGCDTWTDVVDLLQQKEISPTVKNFEKIGTLLNEPDKGTSPKTQYEKDLKRVEELKKELQSILDRHDPPNSPELAQEAVELDEDLEQAEEYLKSQEPENIQWNSEHYLDHIRNFGKDLITGELCERCDPHHTTPEGGTGSQGETLPDFCAIPVSRTTHNLIGDGIIEPTQEEILRAQFTTLATYLARHA